MKVAYKDISFRESTLALIDYMNSLIESYQRQGFTLSVRQLYYQLVARDKIENTEKSYKRIASIINDGRIAGLIDWDAIEDRNREMVIRSRWTSGSSIVDAAAESFHMDLWDSQDERVFVIVEKAALAGVLDGVCHNYDVPLLAARGYPSVSIIREMALDHIQEAIDCDQRVLILHLGDHDPSGIDMTRDLEDRFTMFLGDDVFDHFEVRRIALTMDQIVVKDPPPNPAKTTDSRFAEYRKRFGDESWELDALEPAYLNDLVKGHIEDVIDPARWNEKREEIAAIRERLKKTADEWRNAE